MINCRVTSDKDGRNDFEIKQINNPNAATNCRLSDLLIVDIVYFP